MPLELHIIRASDFVRLDASERLDFEASKRALALLAEACRKRGIDQALLDIREMPVPAVPQFTTAQFAALVETFKEAGFTRKQRLAILYKTDPHHGARKFAFVGTFKGWQVRAFAEFEAALYWLSAGDEADVGAEGEQIPLQNRPPSKAVTVKVDSPKKSK